MRAPMPANATCADSCSGSTCSTAGVDRAGSLARGLDCLIAAVAWRNRAILLAHDADPSHGKLLTGPWVVDWLAGRGDLARSSQVRYEGIINEHQC